MFFPRWQQSLHPVFSQLHQLQGEMNRLLDRWGDQGGAPVFAAEYPLVNVWEDTDAVFVEAEVPGLDPKDLEVLVSENNQLTLKGERRPPATNEKGIWHRQERTHGGFVRVITLPFNVDADKVDARFENGVLHLKLAKHESAKPRKISVKAE